jgi:hypothetical protein
MSYADQAALYNDFTFRGRLEAAVTKESRSKPDSDLAAAVLAFPPKGTELFLPWVTTEPGFDVPDADITDPMLLSAIQAVWPAVEAAYPPPAAA